MVLNYKQMKEILPRSTMRIIDDILPYLDYYIGKSRDLAFINTDHASEHQFSKTFFLLLYVMNNYQGLGNILSSFGFNKGRYAINNDNIDFDASKEELFNKYSYILPDYKDQLEYESLTPFSLLSYWLKQYNNSCSTAIYYLLFSKGLPDFIEFVNSYAKNEKDINNHKLEVKTYGNLPISVINYLETASKIRQLLIETSFDYNKLKTSIEEDLTALSLFIALFNYTDLEEKNGLSISDTIVMTLTNKGINPNGLKITNSYDLNSIKKNINAIRKYYSRFFKEGVNKDKDTSEITVLDICNNLFNRDFTNSIVIEKILSSYGIDIEELKSFKSVIEDSVEANKQLLEAKKIETFYSRTNRNTRSFLETSCKVYSILLRKMEEGKHNYTILTDEDDADTLSLLIASYIFNTDVCKFYTNHGITIEQILDYVGIDITIDDIEREEINEKLLISRFQRFAVDGVNKDKESKKATINEISYNLCNREFNKTTIMEDIFNSLSNDTIIDADFLSQLKNELIKNEKIRKMKLAQEIFKNASNEQIKFYELVSKYHQLCSSKLRSSYNEDDIKTISILFALLSRDDSISEFLEEYGITEDKLRNVLKIKEYNLDNYESDIDIIATEYVPYIKKTEQADDLGSVPIYNLAKNLFKKENNNSINITRLLGAFDLTHESFDDFDNDFESLTLKTKLLGYGNRMDSEIKLAIQLFEYLHEKKERDEINSPYVKTDDDIVTISILIAMIEDESVSDVFKKYGLTQEEFLKVIHLSKNGLDQISENRVNYKLGERFISRFLPKNKYMGIDSIIKLLFDKSFNNSYLIENIIPKKSDYKALKYEIETGQDYEASLTVDERIIQLNSQEVDHIDIDDVSTILSFGSSLKTHAKVIYDELPKLALSDTNEKSVETIRSLTTQVYSQEESQKRGLIGRLFSIDKREISPRITINHEALSTLKETINVNVVQLSSEVHGYDKIRKYLEAYIKKNRQHYEVIISIIEKVNSELSRLDSQNRSQYARFLQLTSILQILKDKANRFMTTIRIAEQDLIRINQSIVSHFITINSLDMAKTDLLPLIGAELAIAQGRMTEKGALDLTRNVIGLFNALLTGNAEETIEGIRMLQETSIPQELLEKISEDIEVHLEGIKRKEELSAIEERKPMLMSSTTKKKEKKKKIRN